MNNKIRLDDKYSKNFVGFSKEGIMFNPYEELYNQLNEIKRIIHNNISTVKEKEPVYFLTDKAADFLSITPNALRVMVSKAQIASCKKLGKRYFLLDDLVKWIESGREDNKVDYVEDILVKNRCQVKK